MKLKTTIFSMFVCLLALSFSASAAEDPACTGNGQDGDYHYQITQADGKTYMTFIPDKAGVGSPTLLFFYGTNPTGATGANSPTPNVPYELTGVTNGAQIYFYFVYSSPAGQRDNAANRHSFIVGDCSGSGTTNTKPVVEITGFEPSNGLVAPETILLTATATDADGTITKVEFFNGTTSIGVGTAGTGNQYNLLWTNVNPGTYNNITAKATDDKLGTTTSDPFPSFNITGEFTNEWCGTSVNGQYQWKAETIGSNVKITFHPLGAAVGGATRLIYTRIGTTGGWAGNPPMTADGLDSYINITKPADGQILSFYFTYNGASMGENNSSANPEVYTVGTQCAAITLPVSLTDFKSKTQADGTVALSWATTSENNNNHFVIERSTDNKNFVALDKIASKGTNSQSRLNYSFTDKNPVNGTNYYRLSQVDNNGNVQVLGIVAETVSLNSLSAIYPNPLHGTTLNISLAGQQDGQVAVDVSTLAGKVIYSGTAQIAGEQGSVSLSSKPTPGLYLVKVGEKSFKLIVE